MERCVVLLRGVNVGSHNRVAMSAFRELLEGLGCTEVRTLLQSGNAVVRWGGAPAELAAAVETELQDRLDLPVAVLVRTAAELDDVVAANPFAEEEVDHRLLHAVFLAGPPPALDTESLLPDRILPGDRVLYVSYAIDSHSSKAAKLLSSRRFPVTASSRNWRTVLALQELARS